MTHKSKAELRKLEVLDVNLNFCKEDKKSPEASRNKKNKEEIEKIGIKSRKRKTRSN